MDPTRESLAEALNDELEEVIGNASIRDLIAVGTFVLGEDHPRVTALKENLEG